jgi:hypothetical protein
MGGISKASFFLIKNSEAISQMLLSNRRSFTIKKDAYDMDIEDELVRLLLAMDGVEQAIPDEKGITIVKGGRIA